MYLFNLREVAIISKEKKSLLDKLFKSKGGCSCGVEIVEEAVSDKKSVNSNDKSKNRNNELE